MFRYRGKSGYLKGGGSSEYCSKGFEAFVR